MISTFLMFHNRKVILDVICIRKNASRAFCILGDPHCVTQYKQVVDGGPDQFWPKRTPDYEETMAFSTFPPLGQASV